jgi:hypothetical protein
MLAPVHAVTLPTCRQVSLTDVTVFSFTRRAHCLPTSLPATYQPLPAGLKVVCATGERAKPS